MAVQYRVKITESKTMQLFPRLLKKANTKAFLSYQKTHQNFTLKHISQIPSQQYLRYQ